MLLYPSSPSTMSIATGHHQQPPPPPPHIALLPSAGMGHLTPLLRLAAMLVSRDCTVTLITPQPPVSAAESTHITAFLAAYPTINRIDLQLLPFMPPNPATSDPFFVQMESIIRSTHLLTPLLSTTSPPISAIFSDIASAAGTCHVADHLSIPNYIVSTTSARFSSFIAYFPYLINSQNSITMAEGEGEGEASDHVHIPSLSPFEISTLPPPFFIPNHIFTNGVVSNARALIKSKGILSNTFRAFEPETISAVNSGKFIPNFPPLLPIGPLQPHKLEVGDRKPLPWLDQQPPKSVVYVSFGSRTAMSKEQITELRNGLEGSGERFLWVVKLTIVDKEESEEFEELVGDKGMVVKGWVNQEEILSHPAIGGFVSHCGWNSVVEAAARGIPVLAWPLNGDQKVNAGVVEAAGLGVWEKGWGWLSEKTVKGEEIGEKVKMMMRDEKLREKAKKIGEEAKKAVAIGGSSDKVLTDIIRTLQHK